MQRTAAAVLTFVAVAGCSDPCSNDLVESVTSPDGGIRAVIFQRACGATTGFSTQISLAGPDDELTGAGTIYRADSDHGTARVGPWGGPCADVRWLGPRHLLIRYADGSRIFAQAETSGGVAINYQRLKP